MPPGSSGCAAGGCLAGPAGALRPPKRRPGDVRPPLPPRPHLSPCPRGHALGGGGGGGARLGDRRREGGAAAREEGEGRESRLGPRSRGRGRRRRGPGSSLGGAPSRRTRLGVRGSLARAGWKVPCRRRRASAAVGACVVGVWGKEGRGRRGCAGRGRGSASRSPRFAARPWWRPGVRPTAAPAPPPSPPPPLRTATVLLSSPPARLAPRVRGRKPAPRPARPRSWPRSRGLRAPGGDPRDAAASSAVARPPPVRGRVVPRRGPVPSFRVGAGRAPPPAGRRPPAPRARPPPPRGGGDGSGGRWAGVCGGGARRPSRPRSVPLPPVVPGGAAGGAVGRGSLSLVFSPRRARLPTERPGAAGRRAGAAFRPPTRPPPPVRLPPSETRPQIRRGDPLNLSILVSGGKETNQDSLSNGE